MLFTGTYTNGHIALLDLAMSTPTTAAESKVPNHVMLTCSTGVGMDERGLAVELHDIEQVDLDIQPTDDAEAVTHLKTQFATNEDGPARSLAFRSVKNGEVTRAWSETWPDQAEVHVEEGDFSHLSTTWIEGNGGVFNSCRVDIFTVSSIPCWRLHARFPVQFFGDDPEGQAQIVLEAPPGARTAVLFEDGGELALSYSVSVWMGTREEIGRAAIELASATRGLFSDTLAAVQGTFDIEFDLDGVGQWAGETPVLFRGGGEVHIDHSARRHSLAVDSPEGEYSGTTVWLDEEPVNKSRPDGPKRKVYKRGGGHEHAQDPSISMRADRTRVQVPGCVWSEEGCS